MKLSKQQKKIVDAIIEGKVYDIPSYLKEFKRVYTGKYNLTKPVERFSKAEGGKQYKVIVDEDKAYLKSKSPMDTGFGTYYVDTVIRKPSIPDDAWEFQDAKLVNNIKPIKFEYLDRTFSFDFVENGVNIANSFDDIIEFMSLWTFLCQESFVLEVSKDITAEELGLLFELKPSEPKSEEPFVIIKDNGADSTLKPILRINPDSNEIYDSQPTFLMTSYMNEEWAINEEHLKNCENYIGRKILPTAKLKVFAQQLYTTSGEWQYRIPLIISIIALIVSFLPIVENLFMPKEPNYLSIISQQLEEIEEDSENAYFNQEVLKELEIMRTEFKEIKELVANANEKIDVENVQTTIEQIEALLERLLKDIE